MYKVYLKNVMNGQAFVDSTNKAVFFLKLSLYFLSHNPTVTKIFNLRGYLLGTRLDKRAALINPLRNILSLYKILIFLKGVIKVNGRMLLVSDLPDAASVFNKQLTVLPNVTCLGIGSIIPGFISNFKWTSWFMLLNNCILMWDKPDVILFLNNDSDPSTYFLEALGSGVPIITFCDFFKPRQMFSVDLPIAAPHNIYFNNSVLLVGLIFQWAADSRLLKLFKDPYDRTYLMPPFNKLYLSGCTLDSRTMSLPIIENVYKYARTSDIVALSEKHLKNDYFNLDKALTHINLFKSYSGFMKADKVAASNYQLKSKYLSTFRLYFKQWKVRRRYRRNKKMFKWKKWRFIYKYKRFFCKKFYSKLKLNWYRTLLLKKMFSNYFDFRYNFKTWWKETKATSLFNRLTGNARNDGVSLFAKFIGKFERQLAFICRKIDLIPSIRLFPTAVRKRKKIFVNQKSIIEPTYIVPNDSIVQKTFFTTYIPRYREVLSLRYLRLIRRSMFFKKFLYLKNQQKRDDRKLWLVFVKKSYLKKLKLKLKQLFQKRKRVKKRNMRAVIKNDQALKKKYPQFGDTHNVKQMVVPIDK